MPYRVLSAIAGFKTKGDGTAHHQGGSGMKGQFSTWMGSIPRLCVWEQGSSSTWLLSRDLELFMEERYLASLDRVVMKIESGILNVKASGEIVLPNLLLAVKLH